MVLTPEIEGTVSIRSSAGAFLEAFRHRVAAGLLTGRPHPRSNYMVAEAGSQHLEVRAADLRAHPKGRTFSLVVTASVGGEPVWTETGTLLHRGGGDPSAARAAGPEPVGRAVPATVEWRLPGDLGRRYAAVSGDRNPIHMHPLTARAFGFPRPIAHGMWSMARCLAQLEGRLDERLEATVSFRRPVPLPGRVRFAADHRNDGSIGFALRGPGETDPALHLLGAARPL